MGEFFGMHRSECGLSLLIQAPTIPAMRRLAAEAHRQLDALEVIDAGGAGGDSTGSDAAAAAQTANAAPSPVSSDASTSAGAATTTAAASAWQRF